MSPTRTQVSDAIVAMLAAENGCLPSHFSTAGIHVAELRADRLIQPPQRRFPLRDHSVSIVTMGVGTVVSATSAWAPWVRGLYENIKKEDAPSAHDVLAAVATHMAKSGYQILGPYDYSLTSSQDIRPMRVPEGYSVEIGGPELAAGLEPTDWPNAVSVGRDEERPTMFVSMAKYHGRVVGLACISADSDLVWQIGIDVAAGHRGRRVGVALTSGLASAALEQDKIPYYGTSFGNIPSKRTAQSAGFYPAWVAVHIKERPTSDPPAHTLHPE